MTEASDLGVQRLGGDAQAAQRDRETRLASPPHDLKRRLMTSTHMGEKLLAIDQLLSYKTVDLRASIVDVLRRVRPPIFIEIDTVDPVQAWPEIPVRVTFKLHNNSTQPTSGFVRGAVWYSWQELLRGRFFQEPARVDNLAPGQVAAGEVLLGLWAKDPGVVGDCSIVLDYYIDDPNAVLPGAVTIVSRDPIDGIQRDFTIGILTTGYGDLDVYPGCQPQGPDFIAIKSFTANPPIVLSDASGKAVASGQSVTLSWEVDGGGFPASEPHIGSIRQVTLDGGPFNNPYPPQVAPQGQIVVNLSGLPVAAVTRPLDLIAIGNCGKTQARLQIRTPLPPPKVVSFTASPYNGYVNLGQPATLSWQVVDCVQNCQITLQGFDGLNFNHLALFVKSLPSTGSMRVTPTDESKYVLTATSAGGIASKDQIVFVYTPPPQGAGNYFYFKMTDPQSAVTPCFTLAVFAPDQATAKQIAENQNGGYTANRIDVGQFQTACG